ncbi:hypothetical protein SAMN05216331_12832 [Porphyromonadaceae bacterium KH3R12]|nr:hypothetical protein SAMN05216331_12832 [Porphyromonadaceae bacterium KH3R12]SFK54816.1 hypothetical protein SAMN05216357_10353 [Porphyromonadaceae bacterium KH3CP3RA]
MNIKRQFTKKNRKSILWKKSTVYKFIHVLNIILPELLKKIFNFAIVFFRKGENLLFYKGNFIKNNRFLFLDNR